MKLPKEKVLLNAEEILLLQTIVNQNIILGFDNEPCITNTGIIKVLKKWERMKVKRTRKKFSIYDYA